jgi:hypothetical protein
MWHCDDNAADILRLPANGASSNGTSIAPIVDACYWEILVKILLLSTAAVLALSACNGREVEVISPAATASPAGPTRTIPSPPVQLDGPVSGASGTCPSLAFTVSRTIVKTSSSTTFDGGCTAVVNGASVSVTGTRQTDDSVAATHVAVRETEVEGAMNDVTGSCPVLTFTVAGTMISMDSTTVLSGLSCSELANGAMVRVSGFRRADGSILAGTISAGRR